MNNLELINIDYFKKNFYKALLPLSEINKFLRQFNYQDVDEATKTLIGIFDISVNKAILANLETKQDKQLFLELIQDNYWDPNIMIFLNSKLSNIEDLIKQTLERTLLSAKKAIL